MKRVSWVSLNAASESTSRPCQATRSSRGRSASPSRSGQRKFVCMLYGEARQQRLSVCPKVTCLGKPREHAADQCPLRDVSPRSVGRLSHSTVPRPPLDRASLAMYSVFIHELDRGWLCKKGEAATLTRKPSAAGLQVVKLYQSRRLARLVSCPTCHHDTPLDAAVRSGSTSTSTRQQSLRRVLHYHPVRTSRNAESS